MKHLIALFGCCLALGLAGCGLLDKIHTHRAPLSHEYLETDESLMRVSVDLHGDGEDLLLNAVRYDKVNYALLLQDQTGKVASQTNPHHRIRTLRVLKDPVKGEQWIFYSLNDQRRVALYGINYDWGVPLKRNEREFESIARDDEYMIYPEVEWWGMLYPEFLQEIDGDGRVELVCRMLDGLTANPRGLAVYDFETGKLKWRYDLSTNITGILFDDFDSNGSREFICATTANKNSLAVRDSLDDMHSWLFVLDTQGKRLYYEKAADDFSEISLQAVDSDRDGQREIYLRQTTWGAGKTPNSVAVLTWNGGRLARSRDWQYSGSFARSSGEFLFQLKRNEGYSIILADETGGLIELNDQLEPQKHAYKGKAKYFWSSEDLNGDGDNELLIRTMKGDFEILDHNLKVRARIENPFPGQTDVGAFTVSGNAGKTRRIALTTPSQVSYYGYKRLPWYLLAFRSFAAIAVPLCLAMLLGILVYALIARHNRIMFYNSLDSLGQGVMILNRKNRIALANQYLQNLAGTGGKPGEAADSRDLRKAFPQIQARLKAALSGKADVIDFEAKLGPGQAPHKVRAFKLWSLLARYLVTVVPLESDSARLSDKIGWAETARRLSHNVRRHINNAILALQPLQDIIPEQSSQHEYAGIIRDEIEKIRVFTHAFQRFTEITDYELSTQDIVPSVEHCLASLSLPPGVQLIKNWTLKSVAAYIEPIRFEEALGNIVNNSLDAMPDGGVLHVTVREYPPHGSPHGDLRILVEVEDSGTGIPAQYQDDIWKAFFTTKQSGTGIGLPESWKIIDSMGGDIQISSEEGAGTIVSVWLKGESK